jgi:DNA-binding transcriptional LysR family regulator
MNVIVANDRFWLLCSMELRHLRYFVTTAECLHFTRAAEILNITQSALSVQIRALETELGLHLLERNNRIVSLTPAGVAFLAEARTTLASAEQAARRARQAAAGEAGRLHIGYVISATGVEVTRAIRKFQEQYPGVELILDDQPEAEQWRRLQREEIDIALTRSPTENEAFSSRVVTEGRFHVMLPLEHRLSRRKSVSISELREEKFIKLRTDDFPIYSRAITQACHQAGFEPPVLTRVRDLASIQWMVSAGMGVGFCASNLDALLRRDIVTLPLTPVIPTRLWLQWRTAEKSPIVKRFLDCF